MTRNVTASNASRITPPSPSTLPCVDDPTYFQQGAQWGKVTNWTSCSNWTGYTCAGGGWGINEPDSIAYLVRACPVSCLDGPCNPSKQQLSYDDFNSYYDSSRGSWESTVCSCPFEWQGDGECDRACNVAACDYDAGDCFHGDSGCYEHSTGADYRGNVSITKDGRRCQFWDSQWPNYHEYTVMNYPDSNLGGHNSCRNPSPEDGSTGPWCIIDDFKAVWGYCEVGPPSSTTCPTPRPGTAHNHTLLELGQWVRCRPGVVYGCPCCPATSMSSSSPAI